MGPQETKSLLTAKDTIIQLKRQPMEWEKKIFTSCISNRRLASRIYKKKKKKFQLKIWGETKQIFSKYETQMA